MLTHPQVVIHFVNVIAGEDHHVFRLLAADGIDVWIYSISRAHVPVLTHAFHGWQNLDEFAEFARNDSAPSFTDVAIERERFVLREDINLAKVGVDAVRECDVDDAVVAPEGHSRLGAVARKWEKTLAGASGQQDSECVLHECSDVLLVRTATY